MFITIRFSDEFRQVLPVIFGACLSVTFGMALGWPSVVYPYLLNDEVTPISISLDDTALIAGFLMEGNTIGALFSTSKFLPAKLAVCLCSALQVAGWLLMFYSRSIFWFLGSRASVGFANGYGIGQLKRYIKDTCEPSLAARINAFLPLGINIGVLITFTYGSFVDFRSLALYALSVPCVGLAGFALLPQLERRQPAATQRIRNILESSVGDAKDANKAIEPQMTAVPAAAKPFGVFELLRDRDSRNALLVMFVIVFTQQYSGGPANIVYSQIIFTSTRNPYPKLCAIVYALAALINMLVALVYSPHVRRRTNLLANTAACALCYVLLAAYFFLRNELYTISALFTWTPLFLLVLFNACHTFSFGALALLQLRESVPKRALNLAGKFWTIHFSMSAVISTKIFQVIYGFFGMGMGYTFFVCVLVATFVVVLFVPDWTPKDKADETAVESGAPVTPTRF